MISVYVPPPPSGGGGTGFDPNPIHPLFITVAHDLVGTVVSVLPVFIAMIAVMVGVRMIVRGLLGRPPAIPPESPEELAARLDRLGAQAEAEWDARFRAIGWRSDAEKQSGARGVRDRVRVAARGDHGCVTCGGGAVAGRRCRCLGHRS